MNSVGLYVHIPFCQVKCKFCDFAAYPGLLKEIPRYLSALEREIQAYRGIVIDTLYFGGGTPSILSSTEFNRLMNSIRSVFTLTSNFEASIECNPETVDAEKLETYRKNGVNRISFGLQVTQERLLKDLGRLHSFNQLKKVFTLAGEAGFKNLNIDLMYGLPGQSRADWKESLDQTLALSPDHLSAYALSIEEKTAFKKSGVEKDDDLQAEMYEVLCETLENTGFTHYEISNFARSGYECRHNLKYWKNQNCLGAGVSAAGYWDGARRKNTERVMEYMDAVECGKSPVIEEAILSEEDRIGEDLMLALRLKEGCTVSKVMRNLYGSIIDKYLDLGYLKMEGNKLCPTEKGWLLSNQMFQEFLTPPDLYSRVDINGAVGNRETLRQAL